MPDSDSPLLSDDGSPPRRELAKLVRELARSTSEPHRALGINLVCDHRIAEPRVVHFLRSMQPLDFTGVTPEERGNKIVGALARYRKETVATRPDDSFADVVGNHNNQVSEVKTLVHVCNVSQKLLRIVSSTSLISEMAIQQLGAGRSALGSLEQIDVFLRGKLRDNGKKTQFVIQFLELLREFRQAVQWHPIWAASSREFQQASIDNIAESWFETVGIPCNTDPPPWLLILQYPSELPLQIFRPTQLEAGAFAYHFPSPDCIPPDTGGLCMHLGDSVSQSGILVPEFIHNECDFKLDHWRDGGERLGRASATLSRSVMRFRARHHALLCEKYTEEAIRAWMKDPCAS